MTKASENKGNGKYAANAFRPALVDANKKGNRRAIRKEDAKKLGIPEWVWEEFTRQVNNLRCEVLTPYVVAKMDNEVSDEELAKLRRKIFPAWRKLVMVGEEDVLDPKIKVRNADVDSLIGFAETYIATSKGTAWSVQSHTLFRKDVEAFLGCKIAMNSVLRDDERDAIEGYYSALRRIKNNENALNGYNTKDGHVDGVLDTLKRVQDEIKAINLKAEDIKELVKEAPEGSQIAMFFINQAEALKAELEKAKLEEKALEGRKSQVEDNIKEAKKQRDENKAACEKAEAKLKRIDG